MILEELRVFSSESATKEDAKQAIEIAKNVFEKIKSILKEQK